MHDRGTNCVCTDWNILGNIIGDSTGKDEMKFGGMYLIYLYYVAVKLLDICKGGKYRPLDIMLGKHPAMGVILSILYF